MPRILICDDEPERASRLSEEIRDAIPSAAGSTVEAVSASEFVAAIAALERRQLMARDTPAPYPDKIGADEAVKPSDGPHLFDDADIVFLDYDLVRLRDEEAGASGSESGERIAYLARCYSRCGTIVAYNQFSYEKTFDLTLRGHLRSFADVNLSSDTLGNRGLWGDDYEGFRPWYWPMLLDEPVRFRQRTQQLLVNSQTPILELLGLVEGPAYSLLTREFLEFLSPEEEPEAATLRDFVGESSQGLRPKDELWEPQAAARIGAARLTKWLERAVLPGQNILVDAPHLVERYPSLLKVDDGAVLNDVCRLGVAMSELGLDSAKLSDAAFLGSAWLSRPAWVWPEVAGDETIPEVHDPWALSKDAHVFCEDASRFCGRDSAHEFVADVRSEFSRRYVCRFEGVRYEPAVRFLM